MDKLTATVLILALLALVVIGFFAVFRRRGKASIHVGGTRLEVEGSNEPGAPAPGVHGKKLKAGGHIKGTDDTGRGVKVVQAEATGDITLANKAPAGGRDPNA